VAEPMAERRGSSVLEQLIRKQPQAPPDSTQQDVTAKLPIGIDGAQLLFATASSDVKELFVTRLASRIEGLPDEAMANECGAVDLEAYVANVRAARCVQQSSWWQSEA
jgi:hypothetical protein